MHTTNVIASQAQQAKPAQQPLRTWFDMLSHLYPPTGVLLVGAGSGSSPWVQHLMANNWPRVTLVEADEATAQRLKAATQNHPCWRVKTEVVGPRSGATAFYSASLPTESGLLAPESLRSLWPNLKTTHKQTRQATTLAELQQDADPAANWLLLDCLPALPILHGAAQQLAGVDVIAVRVLLNASAPDANTDASAISTAAADQLQPALQTLGFRCLTIETSRHPGLGHALFVRDTAAQMQQLTQAKAAAEKLATERQQQLQQIEARNQAAAKAKIELEAALADTQNILQAEILALAAAREAEKAAHAKEKDDLLKAFQKSLRHENAWLAHSCMVSEDIHESVQKIIVTQNLAEKKLFDFLLELSDQIAKSGDKVTALSYLNQSQKALTQTTVESLTAIAKRLINLGQSSEAEALYINAALDGKGVLMLSDKERALLKNASNKLHELAEQRKAHGHDLLISAMKKHLGAIKAKAPDRKLVLLEVGTTREEVPSQGSTRKLAEYCKANEVEFITVDMDPHNSEMARKTFEAISSTGFQAITSKGEDYLRHYSGALDIVFLDAYDFDHGKHSELRQSRYEKFLGSRIDELECHQMHLDCAQSVAKKLSPYGLVCFDDTWLEDGKWTAKGTLGMPFLLANGFEVVEARNNAALLRRVSPAQNTSA